MHHADRAGQFDVLDILEHVAHSSRLHREENLFFGTEAGEHQYFRRRMSRTNFRQSRQAVYPWHAQVHQDYVRQKLAIERNALFPVAPFAHNHKALFRREQRLEPHPKDQVIIDDKDGDRCAQVLTPSVL